LCKKKIKISCKCKRLRKEFQCETVRKGLAVVECDEVCLQKLTEEQKKKEADDEIRRQEEQVKNQKELEMYEKKFTGKKKSREKKMLADQSEQSLVKKYWMVLASVFVVMTSLVIYQAVA